MPDTNLEHLQPAMKKAVVGWLNDCKYEKLPIVIVETHRSYERQAKLYAQGRTAPGPMVTKARPGLHRSSASP